METDFHISTWGRYYLVTAQSTRALAWLSDHWRDPQEPPATRATKVGRLVCEMMYWWDNYEPTYTYSLSPAAYNGLDTTGRILE